MRIDLEPTYDGEQETDGYGNSSHWRCVSCQPQALEISMLINPSRSIIAAIIKVVVSFEITNAGLNSNVDPDCVLLPSYLLAPLITSQ